MSSSEPLLAPWRRALSVAALGLAAAGASAHHSVAYYGDELIELSGELVDVQWRNPHIRLTVETVNAGGVTETWRMEGNSVYNLARGGVTADSLTVGEQVVVAGQRSTREPRMLLVNTVRRADGEELLLWLNNIGRFRDAERLVDAAAENRGIFRVWSVPAANFFLINQLAEQPFTDSAVAARAAWDPLDNFATRCEPEGMPRIMVNPHPFEFIDRGSEIALRTELYDIERTIHMDRDAPPPDAPPSRLGYSVGRWADGALVVTTTRLNWPYFDNIGTPLSEAVEIVERFVLSEDQTRLDFEVTVIDPSTFTRPARLVGYWLALGDTLPSYDCQPLE